MTRQRAIERLREVRYPYFVVDHHADAVYVLLSDGDEVARTESITGVINADYDADGKVIGIEFLGLEVNFGEEFGYRKAEQR
jgi:uncharacterized protein YuzE